MTPGESTETEREVRLDLLSGPRTQAAKSGCEKHSPSTAGLSEHLAVQVASQESTGWSWVEPRALPQVGPLEAAFSGATWLGPALPPGPPLSSLHLSVPRADSATPPAAPPPTQAQCSQDQGYRAVDELRIPVEEVEVEESGLGEWPPDRSAGADGRAGRWGLGWRVGKRTFEQSWVLWPRLGKELQPPGNPTLQGPEQRHHGLVETQRRALGSRSGPGA